jgi:septal ring-binding cell division protein DamX
MPDLNLIDEGGLEESTSSAPQPSRRRGGGGGSLNKILLTILILLIVGTTVFYLYKKGKFPFKKKPPVMAVQEEPFQEPMPQMTAQNPQQQAAQQQPIDTSSVPMLETPMVNESAQKPEAKQSKPAETKEEGGQVSVSKGKLSDMQGNYTVQVSAFHEKKQAEKIMNRLEDAGYPAFVESVPMKGVSWYTVRIGRYESRKDARKAVQDFALELRSNYWIDRVRSK